jgi:hypothetical protein
VSEVSAVERILQAGAVLDDNLYKDLIVLYVSQGHAKKKLKALCEDLMNQQKFSLACFCAQFCGDVKLYQSAAQASTLAIHTVWNQ